jgi:hypothetical protein
MRNQKGGAIFALLAGLIATAVAAGASQAGGGVKKRKPKTQKRKPKRPHRRKYKKRV